MSKRFSPGHPSVCCVCAIIALLATSARADSRPSATRPATTRPAGKTNADVRRGLERQLPKAKFQADMSDAIDFMRDVSGLPIDVQWDKLKSVGVNEKTPVSVNLSRSKMSDILTAILTNAAGKPGIVGYAIDHGTIVVGPVQPPASQPK